MSEKFNFSKSEKIQETENFEQEMFKFWGDRRDDFVKNIRDSLTLGKKIENPKYLYRVTNTKVLKTTKHPGEQARSWSTSPNLFYSLFYLKDQFLRRLEKLNPKTDIRASDTEFYIPQLFIIDINNLLTNSKSVIKPGLEAPNEQVVEGDFTPYALQIDSAEKFKLFSNFTQSILSKEEQPRAKKILDSYTNSWEKINKLRKEKFGE